MSSYLSIALLSSLLFVFGTPMIGPVMSKVTLAGKYELVSEPSDPAYNRYLEALGVLDIFRLVMGKIKINIELEQISDTKFKYIIETPLTTRETTFELGKEQRDTFIDQRKFTALFVKESEDTIKQVMTFDDGPVGISLYKFTPSGITVTLSAKDKKVIREYRREPDEGGK